MDVALAALGAVTESAEERVAKVRERQRQIVPGTVIESRSGRRYVVQQDGSWKRVV